MSSPRPASVQVDVVDRRGRAVPGGAQLARWLAGAAPGRARGRVVVAIVSDADMRRLNFRFRGRRAATDVLSFPADGAAATGRRPNGHAPHLGDVVIARGVARRQAAEAGHSAGVEWRVLSLHGLLHLLGYDHEADDGEMRRLEARLGRRAGLPSVLTARGKRAKGSR